MIFFYQFIKTSPALILLATPPSPLTCLPTSTPYLYPLKISHKRFTNQLLERRERTECETEKSEHKTICIFLRACSLKGLFPTSHTMVLIFITRVERLTTVALLVVWHNPHAPPSLPPLIITHFSPFSLGSLLYSLYQNGNTGLMTTVQLPFALSSSTSR